MSHVPYAQIKPMPAVETQPEPDEDEPEHEEEEEEKDEEEAEQEEEEDEDVVEEEEEEEPDRSDGQQAGERAGEDVTDQQHEEQEEEMPVQSFDVKLGRNKRRLELQPDGIALFEHKGSKPPATYAYQTLREWGTKGKGFEVFPAEGKSLKFSCTSSEAEQICEAMTAGATSLMKRLKAARKAEKAAAKAAAAEAEAAAAAEESEPESASRSIDVTVPDGVASGDTISVEMLDGSELEVVVPDGLDPGDTFEIMVEEMDEEEQDEEAEFLAEGWDEARS